MVWGILISKVLSLNKYTITRFAEYTKGCSQCHAAASNVYVVGNFLFQLIFIFPLFWGMVMYANEFKTKEKQKLTEV